MSVNDYSTNPNANTTISGINIAEGCPPSGINDAIRQMMADVKVLANGYPVASAAVNYYLSATGSDANDGTTAATAKGTWAGMHALLAAVDPRGYAVTVNVSGKIGGNCDLALPRYCPENLSIVGTSTTTDGFTGRLRAVAGGFTPDKISVGQLSATNTGSIQAVSKTIRLTGLPTPGFGICNEAGGGLIVAQTSTIEYSGAYNVLAVGYGNSVYLRSNNFVAIGTPTITIAFFGGLSGGRFIAPTNTWAGAVNLTGKSMYMDTGGVVDIDNPTAVPGGGTITRTNPGNINAKGAAVAYGGVSSSGALNSSSRYGVNSVTKTGTGVYVISVDYDLMSGMVSSLGASYASYLPSTTGKTITISTYDSTGTPADRAFYFAAWL